MSDHLNDQPDQASGKTLDEVVGEKTTAAADRVDDVAPRREEDNQVATLPEHPERHDTTEQETQQGLEKAKAMETVAADHPIAEQTVLTGDAPAAPLFVYEHPDARMQEATVERTYVEAPVAETLVAPAVVDRDALREERNRQLGVVTRNDDPAPVVVAKPVPRTTDRWHGSVGFFLLRLVTGLMVATHGVQRILHLTATKEYFAHSILPSSEYFAWGATIAEIIVGLMLILGLGTRIAGLLLAVLSIGYLVLFTWGKVNPFTDHTVGFYGELELLMAAVGLLFLLLGGGGWGIDRIVRRNRARKKEAKAFGQI